MSTLLLSAPHIHSGMTVSRLMRQVILGLLPALVFGIYLFGEQALLLVVASMVAAIISEWLCQKCQKTTIGRLRDGSAIVTALLLVMSLPPHFPWYLGAFGAAVAVILGKQVYGGLGQNLFNPAMLARVVLLISFPVAMTSWPAPEPLFINLADAFTGATTLGAVMETGSSEINTGIITMLLGIAPGSLGESPLLLLLGGIWMIWKNVIDWRIVVSLIIGCFIPSTIAWLISPDTILSPLAQLSSGGLLLAAFFIATDPVTSPTTPKGRYWYGLGCGLLIFLIRVFGAYPEGVAFAILLMNAVSPLIESCTRQRLYGEIK
ncbi:RnfABCDGE type electron transport complex subunit D [Psychromonas antarctica]|uniref:RnfABCDGE type electron transport complex subunit D n=1 Tax=Psychromonas antarctica TaxID=67573 RepID=UPI001EE7E43A|nr:RnfABCDGE type electron transport complex subunit D [Psychromonas antarctica]MCG6200821.1 RnfABCDGE type electron transport complex subunit D [Psychromonas antarctica]